MKRITRDRPLTPEEAEAHRRIREEVGLDFQPADTPYADMNAAVLEDQRVSDQDAERDLLREVFRILTPAQKRKLREEFERQREAFSRQNCAVNVYWYPHKLAMCAALERLCP